MDAWLKKAVDGVAKLGDEVSKHADSLTQNASLLAEGMLEGAAKEGRFDVTFDEGPLGFELEGIRVAYVDEDEQAARLGVRAGDFLAAVDGYEVPSMPPAEDVAGRKKARATVNKWLVEMPVPCPLTFERPRDALSMASGVVAASATLEQALLASPSPLVSSPEASEAGGAVAASELADGATCDDADAAQLQREASRLRAELASERELVTRFRLELGTLEDQLQEARAECHDLRHVVVERDEGVGTAESRLEVRLRGLQDQLSQARADHEAARRRAVDLQAQLSASVAQVEELRSALARSEEVARESFEGREQVLEEEASRLRAALSALEAESRTSVEAAGRRAAAAEAEVAELRARLDSEVCSLQSRLIDAEGKADRASLDLRLQRDSHASELARLREEGEANARALRAEMAERERRTLRELEEARRTVEELKSEKAGKQPGDGRGAEEDTLVEEGVPEDEEAPAAPAPKAAAEEDAGDAERLREQVAFLERRCATLQKKLNARPIVSMAPASRRGSDTCSAEEGPPPWVLWVQARAGPKVGGLALVALEAHDRMLKSFTQRLLRHKTWLLVFYLHQLVLYSIAASCYAEAELETAQPMEALMDRTVHQGSKGRH